MEEANPLFTRFVSAPWGTNTALPGMTNRCPLCLQKWTCALHLRMFAKGQ